MIGFLQPWVLAGLVLAAVPPLLHLLGRRRPPTVPFPAVRYLSETEREYSRRLKLRNLLLLILRIAVVLLVVLAAARPVVRVAAGTSHPPTAAAIVLDNSLSSSAVVAGQRTLDLLVTEARAVLERTTEDDRVWLVLADAVPRRVGKVEALAVTDSVDAWPIRLDVGEAVRAAAQIVRDAGAAHEEVVVLSDLQQTAMSSGPVPNVPVLILQPPPAPENTGIDSAVAAPAVWHHEGMVIASLGGGAEVARAVQLLVDERAVARTVATSGETVFLTASDPRAGNSTGGKWMLASVQLDHDELRADDQWWLGVRIAPPVAVRVESGAGPFVEEAVRVLIDGDRARAGERVVVTDRPSTGMTVVFPPSDASLVGATNRALAARGVSVRLGDLLEGEWMLTGEIEPLAGVPVYRRHLLLGTGEALATVAGEPWMVREGNVLVIASRMEEAWTALPVSAAFIPFLDFLLNRAAAEQTWIVRGTPGSVARMPSVAAAVYLPSGPVAVPADRRLVTPMETGVYFLEGAAGDTVGALEVNHDPRESRLAPATSGQVRAAFGDAARLLDRGSFARELFGGARRAELTGPLLVAALLAAIVELALASLLGVRRSG